MLHENVSTMGSDFLTGYLIESRSEMCFVLTPLCFGQTTILGSQGFLSQGCLVTESQRGLGERQVPICSAELR